MILNKLGAMIGLALNAKAESEAIMADQCDDGYHPYRSQEEAAKIRKARKAKKVAKKARRANRGRK